MYNIKIQTYPYPYPYPKPPYGNRDNSRLVKEYIQNLVNFANDWGDRFYGLRDDINKKIANCKLKRPHIKLFYNVKKHKMGCLSPDELEMLRFMLKLGEIIQVDRGCNTFVITITEDGSKYYPHTIENVMDILK